MQGGAKREQEPGLTKRPRTGPDPRKKGSTGEQRPRLRSYLPPADSPVSQMEPHSLRRRSLPPPPAPQPVRARFSPTNHRPPPAAPARRLGPAASPSWTTGARAGGPEPRPRTGPGATWEIKFPGGGAPEDHVINHTNWRVSYCGTAPELRPMRSRLRFPPVAVMAPPVRYCIPGKCAGPIANSGWDRGRKVGWPTPYGDP